jgi:GntR family transcriptional regulator, arabinose operon transcriptional repressor
MNTIRKDIYNYILAEILSKRLRFGERLPTEFELAEKFATNRSAAHRAVKSLEDEGLVTRHKGRGTFVSLDSTKADGFYLKCDISKTLYVIADTSKTRNIHWDSNTLLDMERSLCQKGNRIVYKKLPETRTQFQQLIAQISESGAMAIVFMPDQFDTDFLLENQDILSGYNGDIYMLSRGGRTSEDYPCHVLSANPRDEGEMAGQYLIKKGYQEIYFLQKKQHPVDKYWVKNRREGAASGTITASEGHIKITELRTNHSDNEIYSKAIEAIKKPDSRCAFIALNDNAAVEFIDYAEKEGLQAGIDYGIISFDNSPLCRNYNLTTIAPPLEKAGQSLAKMIMEKDWKKANGAQLIVKLKSYIIERSTC